MVSPPSPSPSTKSTSSDVVGKAQPKVHKPPSAFGLYSQDTRKAVKAEGEAFGLTTGQVTKLIRQRWDALDAESKAPYEARSSDAKAKYDEAVADQD